MLTYEAIRLNKTIHTYIEKADESLKAQGFTEHSFAHAIHVAETSSYILETLGYDERIALCNKAAEKLGLQFHIIINGQQLI